MLSLLTCNHFQSFCWPAIIFSHALLWREIYRERSSKTVIFQLIILNVSQLTVCSFNFYVPLHAFRMKHKLCVFVYVGSLLLFSPIFCIFVLVVGGEVGRDGKLFYTCILFMTHRTKPVSCLHVRTLSNGMCNSAFAWWCLSDMCSVSNPVKKKWSESLIPMHALCASTREVWWIREDVAV